MSSTPRAVRRQAAEADRLLRELNTKPGETPPDQPPAPPAQPDQPPAQPDQPPAPPAPPAQPDQPPVEDFKQKYLVLKGKFDREIPELRAAVLERDERIRNLEHMLEQAAKTVPTLTGPARAKADPASKLIKPEEEEEYGKEFFDVVGRRAREIIDAELAPFLAAQADQDRKTKTRTAEERRQAVFSTLAEQVPNWEALNASQEYLAWLAQVDVFSGRVKQELLTTAFMDGDAARVVQFFKAFQEDSARALAPAARIPSVDAGTLVAPGTPRGGGPADAPGGARVWTQAEIGEFYADVRRGKVKPEQKAAIEADIIRAAAEGRVR